MKAVYLAAPIAATVGLVGVTASSADAAAILVQDRDGDVFSVDTGSGTATLFRDLDDVDPTSGNEDNNSPNGLAFDGRVFNSDFAANLSGNAGLFVEGVQVGTVATSPNQFAVAAGAITDGLYAYIDRDSNLRTTSTAGLSANTSPLNVSPAWNLTDANTAALGSMGDLAFSGGEFVVAHGGDQLSTFTTPADLTTGGTLQATTTVTVSGFGSGGLAGLAYAGGTLFGINGGSGTPSSVFAINATNGDISGLVSILTGTGDNVFGTDASVVPLPAAAWLMIGGLGAVGAAARHGRKKRAAADA